MASLLYQKALNFYQWLAAFASGAYMRDITFGSERHLRGNWDDRVDAIEKDASGEWKNTTSQKRTLPRRPANVFVSL